MFFVARYAGLAIFDNSLAFVVLGVGMVSLLEGMISVSLFEYLDPTVPWWGWMFGRVLPSAVYNTLLAPLVWLALNRLDWLLEPQEV